MSLRGCRTLILDNSPITRDRVVAALRESGVERELIFSLQNIDELKNCFIEKAVELAFIDHSELSINVFDALDLRDEIAPPKLAHLVVTALSPSEELVEELARRGVSDFLAKPISDASLKMCLAKIITEKKSGFRELILEARKQLQLEQPEIAHDLLKKALKINPKSAEACSLMGITEEKLENLDSAVVYHRRCLAIDENYFESLESLFFILNSRGVYNEAYEFGTRLIKINRISEKISCRVIHLVFILKVYDDILPLFYQLISVPGIQDSLVNHLGVALYLIGKKHFEEGREELAFACFDALVENDDYFVKYVKLAFLGLMELERFDEAQMYMGFVEDEDELRLCTEVQELEFISDSKLLLTEAKLLLSRYPDKGLKRYLEKKLEKFGHPEESVSHLLES